MGSADEDLSLFVPSLLNPRLQRLGPLNLTQRSGRTALSLKKKRTCPQNITSQDPAPVQINRLNSIKTICNNDATQKILNENGENFHTSSENITLYSGEYLPQTPKSNVQVGESEKESMSNELTILACNAKHSQLNIIPKLSINFGVKNCNKLNITTQNTNTNKISITHHNNEFLIDCDLHETCYLSVSSESIKSEQLQTKNVTSDNSGTIRGERDSVSVNLQIKRKKTQHPNVKGTDENSEILVLDSSAVDKLSHIIVQPPQYKSVKCQFSDIKKPTPGCARHATPKKRLNKSLGRGVNQKTIKEFFKNCKSSAVHVYEDRDNDDCIFVSSDEIHTEMSKKSKGDNGSDARQFHRSSKIDGEASPKKINIRKALSSEVATRLQSSLEERGSSCGKYAESLSFALPKSKPDHTSLEPRTIPSYKIVAGTQFAVDAFSYDDVIPNVKAYFLTHFHSDHYTGLKRTFNKVMYCSKITADLCVLRLGVNAKYINIINVNETRTIDGVQVTAVDANHCPGSLMLIFGLPSGKNILHCGDFRATHVMESYPVFWNKDIHTIYLDTTYCNPRYDFPSQDDSMEMAVNFLQQKKLALERHGKKFSGVLIVCGTYTIGKEKFFLGLARRIGASVWACPEKDRILQLVEGRSFTQIPPHLCQIHVVPMRDLTIMKLHSYLERLQGAFAEVVAFKPSGWENGKNSTIQHDDVTIHGIPYSEHSSYSEMLRFVNYLRPKLVIPTVDIAGGIKSAQKYFSCQLAYEEDVSQTKIDDFFSSTSRTHIPAVT